MKLESDGQRFWVRDGQGLLEPIPVVIVGHVDPDEKNAGEFGDGISPSDRSTEGFYGPRDNTNPGDIVVVETAVTSDVAGVIAGPGAVLAPAPGTGVRYRLLGVMLQGANLVGGILTIHGNTLITNNCNNGHDFIGCNVAVGEDTALSCAGAGMGNTITYTVKVRYRTEDVVT